MMLSASPAFIAAVPARPALDALSRQGREDLLDLIWAAWFASRPQRTQDLLVHALDDGPEAVALLATAQATVLLRRLRTVAPGDAELMGIVDGLLEGELMLHVPPRLRRVLAAGDGDRRRALARVRAETGIFLPRHAAEAVSAVIGYLIGTELGGDGTEVREVPRARGYCRSVMSSFGLPFDSYMGRMRGWL